MSPPDLTPASLDELQDAILEANERGEPLEIVGGGSKSAIGAPAPEARRLDLGRFNALVDYDPAELVLTAGAAANLAEIETLLEGHGQMLAFEPLDFGPLLGGPVGAGTLGGMIAANAAGPRRLTAGAARDHFLGVTAVSGRGDIFKGGGKVVKNVTGYDVPKLIAGSWGTLAAAAEVTLKVLPRARTQATALIHGLSDQDACRAMATALGGPAGVTAAAHLPGVLASQAPGLAGSPGAATLLRLEGVEASIRAGVEILRKRIGRPFDLVEEADSRTLWRFLRDGGPLAAGPRPLWRASVPPAQGWQVMQALAGQGFDGFYDWAGGLLWIAAGEDADAGAAAVRAAVQALGGHATLLRASPDIRGRVPTFQPAPGALSALSERVKAAFDPKGVLGPRHRLAPPAGA